MTEHDASLEEARARLEGLAKGLAVRFGTEQAAKLLANVLVGLCMAAGGRVAAIEFLEDVTEQLREYDFENWSPDSIDRAT